MKNMDAEDAAKFKEYMSSEKRDMSYIMAFGTFKTNWEIDDVHVSEDLLSVGTLEMIEMFFSKRANVMFVWRIDSKNITYNEATTIHDYVIYDMEDFMSEGDGDKHKSIYWYLITPEQKCLILTYDKPALGFFNNEGKYKHGEIYRWRKVAESFYKYAIEQTEKIATGDETYHDDLMDVMTGKKQSGQQFDDAYKKRKI